MCFITLKSTGHLVLCMNHLPTHNFVTLSWKNIVYQTDVQLLNVDHFIIKTPKPHVLITPPISSEQPEFQEIIKLIAGADASFLKF